MVSFLQNQRSFVSFTGTEEYFVSAEPKAFLAGCFGFSHIVTMTD